MTQLTRGLVQKLGRGQGFCENNCSDGRVPIEYWIKESLSDRVGIPAGHSCKFNTRDRQRAEHEQENSRDFVIFFFHNP